MRWMYFYVFSCLAPVALAENTIVLSDFDVPQISGVTEEILFKRIRSSLDAVGMGGRVVFLNGYILNHERLYELGLDPRLKMIEIPTGNTKQYPWIRDEIAGWSASNNGFVLLDIPNQAPWIHQVLDFLGHPEIKTTAIKVPWGNFISNHHGVCLISDKDLDANERKTVDSVYRDVLGCSKLIIVPEFVRIHHQNRHLDLFASFVDEHVLAIASVPDHCDESDYDIRFLKKDLDQLQRYLVSKLPDVRFIKIPFAKCPRTIDPETDQQSPSLELFTYLNLVSFKDALLLPHYLNEAELDVEFEHAAELIALELKGLGISKKIFPFSIPEDQAMLGGSARCLTWDAH